MSRRSGCGPTMHQSSTTRSFSGSTRIGSTASSSMPTDQILLQKESKIVEDALYRIRNVNNVSDEIQKTLIPFQVDGVILGKVRPKNADLLVKASPDSGAVFELESTTNTKGVEQQYLTLSQSCGSTADERSDAVASVMNTLREQNIVRGWRDELYPVAERFYDQPMFLMERAAVPLLGILEYGVHINGLVRPNKDEGETNTSPVPPTPKMWMGRRSATKSKYPGMVDHIVAGGQPAGLSLMDNVIKECLEEAGIPEEITRAGIRSAGVISYESYSSKSETISRTVLFNYDLFLPSDFRPKPVDGEVQDFFLWSVDEILASMAPDFDDPIKPNCYIVIIDWLIREGHLSPDIPGYLDVVRELRGGDCQ